MGEVTKIEWTDHTFNPWIGCTKVSPGCANCYAKTRDDRHMLGPVSHWGPGAPRHETSAAYWREPMRWARQAAQEDRRHKVFTASQADIFDAEAPVESRRGLWTLIAATHEWLDWQIVTKRPERIRAVMEEDYIEPNWFEKMGCWLIVSTENQECANLRIPAVLQIPAAVHGISAEPLLGPIDLTNIRYTDDDVECLWNVLTAYHEVLNSNSMDIVATAEDGVPKLDWVIVGGESGPGARPIHSDWARSLRDQCKAAGVPFFFKQWGEWTPGENVESNTGIVTVATWGVGRWFYSHENLANDEGHRDDEPDAYRIGKKAAGALLDGVSHKAFPEVQR